MGETEINKEEIKDERGEEETGSNEKILQYVPLCSKISTKLFLFYFGIVTILTIIFVKVVFFPSTSAFDVFADPDTDIESDSEIGPDSPVERLYVPVNRGNSGDIHTFNTDGSGYKILKFGLYKSFDHVHAIKPRKDLLLLSFKRGSHESLSYFFNWEKNTISESITQLNSSQMVTDYKFKILAFVRTDKNEKGSKTSILIADKDPNISNIMISIESDKFNYSLPRFGEFSSLLFYVENAIDSNDKFVIKCIDIDDMQSATVIELNNRPEEMYVSANFEILIKIRTNDGNYELMTVDAKKGTSKSFFKSKKEIFCVGWSSDGLNSFFTKKTGLSGRNVYKTITKADGKVSFRSIKDEKGNKIRF